MLVGCNAILASLVLNNVQRTLMAAYIGNDLSLNNRMPPHCHMYARCGFSIQEHLIRCSCYCTS